jgi:hypothetical protein
MQRLLCEWKEEEEEEGDRIIAEEDWKERRSWIMYSLVWKNKDEKQHQEAMKDFYVQYSNFRKRRKISELSRLKYNIYARLLARICAER